MKYKYKVGTIVSIRVDKDFLMAGIIKEHTTKNDHDGKTYPAYIILWANGVQGRFFANDVGNFVKVIA